MNQAINLDPGAGPITPSADFSLSEKIFDKAAGDYTRAIERDPKSFPAY